jgi:hypothetical protein
MKIVQCPEWCVGDSNKHPEDFFFIIKTEQNGYTHRKADGEVTKFFSSIESEILNPRDITILDNIAED